MSRLPAIGGSNESVASSANSISMAGEGSLLFNLTAIHGEKSHRTGDELMGNVRREHQKISAVVEAFRNKVDLMVDRQRHEYLAAYDLHVQDVQKEIHVLREKVIEIANDQTKSERKIALKTQLDDLKHETMSLENSSDELRSTLVRLLRRIHQVEKARDWMLRKLRQAKKEYNRLLIERSQFDEQSFLSDSMGSFSIDISQGKTDKEASVKRFAATMQSHTTLRRNVTLPSLHPGSDGFGLSTSQNFGGSKSKSTRKSTSQWLSSSPSTRSISDNQREAFPVGITRPSLATQATNDSLGKLVALRSMQKDLRQFVKQCSQSLHRRPWCRVERRPLPELLQYSLDISRLDNTEASLLPLACELAVCPEVYDVIQELLDETRVEDDGNESPNGEASPMISQRGGLSAREAEKISLEGFSNLLNWAPPEQT